MTDHDNYIIIQSVMQQMIGHSHFCTRLAHGTMLNLQDSILGLDTVVNSQSCTYIMYSDCDVMLLCVCVELIITPLRTDRCLMRWRKQIK